MLSVDSCWEAGGGAWKMAGTDLEGGTCMMRDVQRCSLFRHILSEHLVRITSTAGCSSTHCLVGAARLPQSY